MSNSYVHSGILLVDKPEGVTSFEVVRRARRALKIRKIGHLGTLDPFATGLLPLCLQEATKLVPFLMPEPKTYRAELRLGVATATQDLTGEVVARSEIMPGPEAIRQAAASFVGDLQQLPPMYSAVHYQGERLYRLARRGEVAPDRQPRRVTVYRLEVEEVALPLVTITVTCSQGTYIRTLAADLGKALGCGAHLTALRRLQVGPFTVAGALPLADLETASYQALAHRIIPLEDCLPGMRPVEVAQPQARQLRQGQALKWDAALLELDEPVRVITDGELVAVARVRSQPQWVVLTPVRVFAVNSKQ